MKANLQNSLSLVENIGNFCFLRKDKDNNKALLFVSSNLDTAATLFTLLIEQYENLVLETKNDNKKEDLYKQIGNLIIDQSRFTFVSIISCLEFSAKNIALIKDSQISEYLLKNRKKKRYYLKDILHASKELQIIKDHEEKEWEFFLDIRNSIVHNNACVEKNLHYSVYKKNYLFENNKEMGGDIQTLLIFTKRVVEIFYDWSQKYESYLKNNL